MKIEFACRVEQGVREYNDDRALILNTVLDSGTLCGEGEPPAVAAVCDGCGGYVGGGVAAETVLFVLTQALPETLADPERLSEVLEAAKRTVYEKKREMPRFSEMCTTVAGCVFREDGTIIFHAGDSRVYRYDGYSLARMTVDHSAVQSMVDAGRLSPEESRTNPQRNVISRCIGIDCLPPEIYISNSPIMPGETFLMCSDGLWECMEDEEIKRLLDQGGTPADQADRLVDYALQARSDDNISVCICARRGDARVMERHPFVLD